MKIRVLGGDGGIAPGYQTTSFQINGNVLIDAGSVATTLTLREQEKIDYIFLSHTHLDHVKDLCFLADNMYARRKKPIEILSTPAILQDLQAHIFNNKIWPDFSKIENGTCPILAYRAVEKGFAIGSLEIDLHPVAHPVPAVGFILREKQKNSVVISGDTGPTELLWQEAKREAKLKAVFTEIAFPNRLQRVATLAGHFTPSSFRAELEKIGADAPLFIYHLKPEYAKELLREIKSLKIPRLKLLKTNQRFTF